MAHVLSRQAIIMALTLGVATAAAAAEDPGARRLTLKECLALAAAANPDLKSADSELEAAAAGRRGALGSFGPKLKVEGSYLRWDEPLYIDFAASLGPLMQAIGPLLQAAGVVIDPASMQPMPVREQYTKAVTATVTQPLTPLWTIYEAYRLRDLGVDVAAIRRQMTQNDVAYQVTEAFYRALQARGLAQIAERSVAQISSQVDRARAFLAQGMVGENDVLRAELGLAAANQRLIQMRGTVTLASGRLALLIGLPADTVLEPVANLDRTPATEIPESAEIQRRAIDKRPELKELAARTDQARAAKTLAWSRMVPTVAALGSYSYNKGSMFQPERSWYVGGVMAWDVWEWGATYAGIDEADARLTQALELRTKIENLIRLEAHSAVVSLTGSAEALRVAERAVRQAEENFRIENKRYEAAASTTFDVLDAETLLTTARTQQQTALFDLQIAAAAIVRVTGAGAAEAAP
ncbi:MAG: TolC family protein [Deltaproteobacteria bacterium]|nr:TolC family protein [Deltaproteobacteria bacterium]